MLGAESSGAPQAPDRGTLESVSMTMDETDLRRSTASDVPWVTLVWDDPVNLMSYVAYVFRSYFGFDQRESERLMMQVHTKGKAVVATGARERMEMHVEALHGYGLQATVARADE
jgi:ATP-dependent Clp protease adaptor protein ClpS